MNLKKKVRAAVSKDRIRFNDQKHNLDLSYITNNVIAMAFPASGIEATYRNDIDEVSRMLETYHKNNYMIWNLSGRSYDYSKFNHQVLNFGFPDHHSPPLDLLIQIIVSMDNWLSASPEHVAVIHCVGGKGRTGTVISCYLIFTGYFSDPQEALLHFAYMRSMKERGVTQTSQKRYVTYFQNILRNTVRPHPKVLRIRRVVMTAVPCWTKKGGCRPYVNIYHTRQDPRQLVHTTRYSAQTKFYHMDDSSSIIWDIDCMVKGDVLIKFYHLKENQEKVINKTKDGSKKKFEQSMFRISFHTAFVELQNGGLILKKADLDIYHKPKRFCDSLSREDFAVIVIMEEVEQHMAKLYEEEDAAITATYEQFFNTINSERVRTRRERDPLNVDGEESDVDSFAATDDEDTDSSTSLNREDSADFERVSFSSEATPGSASPPSERAASNNSQPKEEKSKSAIKEGKGKEKNENGDGTETRSASVPDDEPTPKRKASVRKIKKKLSKLTKSTDESRRKRKKDKADSMESVTKAPTEGEEKNGTRESAEDEGSAVRFVPSTTVPEKASGYVKKRPATAHTKTLNILGSTKSAIGPDREAAKTKEDGNDSSSDEAEDKPVMSTSMIERGSDQVLEKLTRSSSMTNVTSAAPASRRRPQTVKLPSKPLPPCPASGQDGQSGSSGSESFPLSRSEASWGASRAVPDRSPRVGTGGGIPPRKSSASLSSHRGVAALKEQ